MGKSSGTLSDSGPNITFATCEAARKQNFPTSAPCICTGGNVAPAAKSMGSPVGDALNAGANMWILQNIKNPYGAVFAQNFTQGFLTGVFSNNPQRQQAYAELQRQQEEAAERARLAEQQRQDAIFARLNSQLKLSGGSDPLVLKTSSSTGTLAMKLSDPFPGLQMKLGDSPGSGYGIPGLPGIYVGGPAQPVAESDGLKMKVGDLSPPAPAASFNGTITGLPGIYLGNVEPAHAAELAAQSASLSGPEQQVAQDAALQAAAKNPELTAPSNDPLVNDCQQQVKNYGSALQQQQDALQKASEAEGRAEADKSAITYAQQQMQAVPVVPEQQQSFQKMLDAAHSDEDAAVAARKIFEQADVHLTIVRQSADDSLSGLAPVTATIGDAPRGTASSTQTPKTISTTPYTSNASAPPSLGPGVKPVIFLHENRSGAPHRESVSECLQRYVPADSKPPTMEELERKLESVRHEMERMLENRAREKEDAGDWLNDLRKAGLDASFNLADKGVEGIFESTREGLTEAEIELHGAIEETNAEARAVHSEMAELRKQMEAAQGNPLRLGQLEAEWGRLEKNKVEPLLQARQALESRWQSTFTWEKRVGRFNNARDFGVWFTDTEMPYTVKDGQRDWKPLHEDYAPGKIMKAAEHKEDMYTKFWADDYEKTFDGLKLALKLATPVAVGFIKKHPEWVLDGTLAAKLAAETSPIGEAFNLTNFVIDLTYDGTVGILTMQRLRQAKANDEQFAKAKVGLEHHLDRLNAEIGCYQGKD